MASKPPNAFHDAPAEPRGEAVEDHTDYEDHPGHPDAKPAEPPLCSICRGHHGLEIIHECE